MKKQIAVLASLIAVLIIAATPLLTAAAAPLLDNLGGEIALAHWNYQGSSTRNGVTTYYTITVDAIIAQYIGSQQNVAYVTVTHTNLNGGQPSDVTTTQTFSSWSMSAAAITIVNAQFPWGIDATGNPTYTPHTVAMTWTAVPNTSPTTDSYIDQNSNTVTAVGQWQACTTSIMIDGGAPPHGMTLTNGWGVIGLRSINVAPEYPVAALGALGAAVIAFACYRAMPKLKTKFA